MWKPVFAHDAVSGPSASGDEGPVWWVDARRSFLPICPPPGFLLRHPSSNFWQKPVQTQRLSSPYLLFPRPGPVSRRSFPASTPCPGFPVMVCLLAVTESPGQGSGRTQAWVAGRELPERLRTTARAESFVLTSKALPSPGTKLKAPLGSSRDRHPRHHPSRAQGGRGASF